MLQPTDVNLTVTDRQCNDGHYNGRDRGNSRDNIIVYLVHIYKKYSGFVLK